MSEPNTTSIADARGLRVQMEQEIKDAIRKFEAATGFVVSDVSIDHSMFVLGRAEMLSVKTLVTMP